MRNSALARRPSSKVQTSSFNLKGGLNLVDSPLSMPPGMCLAAINYELLAREGYRRVDGYERFDGQTSPSDAAYWILNYNIWTAAFVDDATVTGGSSGATGKVLLDVPGTTNGIKHSEQFDHADWVKGGTPVTAANSTLAPDATTTADTLEDNDAAAHETYKQAIASFVVGNTYTVSIFVLKDAILRTTRFPLFRLQFTGSTTENNDVRFDTSDGSSQVTGIDPSITANVVTDTDPLWWRIDLTAKSQDGSNTAGTIWIYPSIGASATFVDGVAAVGSIIAWGAQSEIASTVGKYTRTEVAASTRGGHVVLTSVVGTFTDDEDLEVSAVKKAEADKDALLRAASTSALDATHAQDAIETQRGLIGVVGAGDNSAHVRGVHTYNGDQYAFRDNAAVTLCLMYKATTAGWVLQALGNRVAFTLGTAAFLETETLTQTGTTSTINRIVLQSGTFAGNDAAGYLIIGTVTSGPYASGVATSGSGSATLSGAEVANTIGTLGRFEFENDNFFGSTKTQRMYGVSGVSEAFEWDGTVFVPILTGNTVDKPNHLVINEFHLQLAFANGSLQNSATGDPYVWAGSGAAEIGIGADILGFKKEVGGALFIMCRDRTFALHGKNTVDLPWDLKPLSEEGGGIEYTLQRIGQTRYLDDRGFMSVAAVQAFGDFITATYSQVIEPLIKLKKTLAIASIIVKGKSQLRTFFSDGTGVIATFDDNKLAGFTTFVYQNAAGTSIVARCTANGEDSDGTEIMFIGSDDGFVYQIDKGTSFDGGPVAATFALVYNNLGTPAWNKQFKKVVMDADGATGTVLNYNAVYDYSSGKSPVGITLTETLAAGGSLWNAVNWNQFVWAADDVSLIEGNLEGVGRNIALQVSSTSTYIEPHTLLGVTYHYIKRKLVR